MVNNGCFAALAMPVVPLKAASWWWSMPAVIGAVGVSGGRPVRRPRRPRRVDALLAHAPRHPPPGPRGPALKRERSACILATLGLASSTRERIRAWPRPARTCSGSTSATAATRTTPNVTA